MQIEGGGEGELRGGVGTVKYESFFRQSFDILCV